MTEEQRRRIDSLKIIQGRILAAVESADKIRVCAYCTDNLDLKECMRQFSKGTARLGSELFDRIRLEIKEMEKADEN